MMRLIKRAPLEMEGLNSEQGGRSMGPQGMLGDLESTPSAGALGGIQLPLVCRTPMEGSPW